MIAAPSEIARDALSRGSGAINRVLRQLYYDRDVRRSFRRTKRAYVKIFRISSGGRMEWTLPGLGMPECFKAPGDGREGDKSHDR